MTDDEIRKRWRAIERLYRRGVLRSSSLAQKVAFMLADKLEAEGVTEADIDRVFAS